MSVDSEYRYDGSEMLRYGEQLHNYNRAIADLIARRVPRDAKVLDFGAGWGTLTRAVSTRIGKPSCVEPDERQRRQLDTDGYHCYARIADVPDAAFDVVYSSNVLEHIEDDVAALRDVARALRPDGTLILYLPAFQSLYSAVDAAIGHFRRYDVPTITQRLEAAGFRVVDAYYADLLGFFVSWIFKAVSNKVGSVNVGTLRVYDRIIFPASGVIERMARFPLGKNVVAIAVRKNR